MLRKDTRGSAWICACSVSAVIVLSPMVATGAVRSQEPTSPAARQGDPADAGAEAAAQTPPGGKWLVDDQGRQYYVKEVPKVEGDYRWIEENKKVMLPYGVTYDVVGQTAKSFLVKIYRTVEEPSPRRGPTADERAMVEASYRPDITDGKRLSLEPASDGLPTHGQWRNGFAVADMNGDGNLDIVHGPPRKGGSRPVIFLGDGHDHWHQWTGLKFPPIPFDYGDVAAADFNRDGKMDLVVASHLRGLVALVGDGEGGFRPWSRGLEFVVPGKGGSIPSFSSRAVRTLDWNQDGLPDIMALGEGPRMIRTPGPGEVAPNLLGQANGTRVFLNQGNGTWKVQSEPEAHGLFGDALAVGDFNGDGRLDFATASSSVGRKDILHLGQPGGGWVSQELAVLRPSAVVGAVAAGDFDGDGRDDLLVGYVNRELGKWRSGIDLYLARPDGPWVRRTLWEEDGQTGVWSVAVGDLDGDGAPDAAGITGGGQLRIFLGDGKGGLVRDLEAEKASAGIRCRGYHVALADVDRDGDDELIAAFAQEPSAGELAAALAEMGASEALSRQIQSCPSGGMIRAWDPSPLRRDAP